MGQTLYEGHSTLEIAGQVIMAVFFIFQGVKNVLKWRWNVGRLVAYHIPLPNLFLASGFAFQFTGAVLLLFDLYTRAAVLILIFFTVMATAVFHRYWRMEDPVRAEYHFLLMTYNGFVIGALLLLL